MSSILPRGLYTQITGKPTVVNSGKQAGGALTSAKAFSSNAGNITTGTIQTDVLPLATATTPGIIQPDEVTIHVNATGIINAITATSSSLGIVKPDNTTITINGSGVISAPAALGGTVTSVGLALPAEFTVTGSPVVTAGTLTATWANESANKVFAGPTTGAATTPSFRSLVNADMPATGAGSGTVTSVAQTVPTEFAIAGSPITSSGTLAITKQTQTANTIWAGPTGGGAAQPTFRALVTADLPAGTGTVTSVALTVPSFLSVSGSPITTSGTLAVTLATETANTVFSGPTSGGAVAPTFRALVVADIPNLGANPTATASDVAVNGSATTYMRSDGAPAVQKGSSSVFGIVKVDNTTITASSGVISTVNNGTVTSVALTMPAIFSVAGSPITTSGTLAVTLANESANTIWSGPTSGGATTPTFRTMVIKDTPVLGANPATTDVLTTQAQQYARSQLMGF